MSRIALVSALFVALAGASFLQGAEPQPNQKEKEKEKEKPGSVSAALEQAKKRATAQTYELRYQFHEGETFRWTVTHLVTVLTKIRGSEQTAKTRSVSTKLWKVASVDADGNATLVHSVESVDMWQQISGRPEVRYNSEKDKAAPLEYEQVAKSIGQPLTTFSVNRQGVLLNRHDDRPQYNPGLGQLILPLPAQAVKIGDTWSLPQDVSVRLESSEVKIIKTRERYRLDKVEAGIATIAVETQVLTPLNDPKIQAQLVQRLTKGSLKFDLDGGRLLSKQIDLDESVIGFSGADSQMQYLARLSEEVAPTKKEGADEAEASTSAAAAKETKETKPTGPVLAAPVKEVAEKPPISGVDGSGKNKIAR